MVMETIAQSGLCWEVAPSRINMHPCLLGQTQAGSARRAGPCPREWKDSSCYSGHFSWLGGAPTEHKMWDSDQSHYMLSFFTLLFLLHVSPVKPFQDRHWAVKTGPIKSCIFSFQHFGREHFPCCQGHHLSASFCIWSTLTSSINFNN